MMGNTVHRLNFVSNLIHTFIKTRELKYERKKGRNVLLLVLHWNNELCNKFSIIRTVKNVH